jgi:Pycsar effector protein
MDEKLPKKKGAARSRETLFRVVYRTQNNLIQMADKKANIIISINTMIISSIIAISGYGVVADKLDHFDWSVLVPIVVIMLSCLVSGVFAIQAARPKLIRANRAGAKDEKSSLFFFGVIAKYRQHEYLDELQKLFDSGTDVYLHMSIDLYNQGLVLKRKYNLLGYAYQIFMFGFILGVVVFLGFLAMGM